MERVWHKITLKNEVGLFELQRESWQYFAEKLLAITEDPNFIMDGGAALKRELTGNVLKKVKICQKFYMNINDFCENSFKEYILSSPPYILETIVEEIQLEWTDKEDFETISPQELLKYLDLHSFQYDIFPTRNVHIKVPAAKISNFLDVIEEEEVLSTASLYELFWGTKSHGFYNAHFLCAFMGGSKE